MDDRQRVDRALGGDRAAQRELYEAHVDRVYRLAFRMVGEDALARDLTQDTFVRAFEKLDGFRGDAAFSTWLHSVATSVILNGLRRRKRIETRERQVERLPETGMATEELEPDLKERLARAVRALPEAYRAVFVMHDLEGFTHREIAEVLEVKTGTSKARLSRARARLRIELREFAEEWVA